MLYPVWIAAQLLLSAPPPRRKNAQIGARIGAKRRLPSQKAPGKWNASTGLVCHPHQKLKLRKLNFLEGDKPGHVSWLGKELSKDVQGRNLETG